MKQSTANRRGNWGLWLLLVVALGYSALCGGHRFAAYVGGMTCLYILWTAGMNLIYGYTGLLPLMFGGVAGIGAYAMVWLVQHWGWSFWLAMPAALLVAAVTGVVLGLPALRLRGFYFALSSLVIQAVISLAFVYFSSFTNGDTGINQIAAPDIPFTAGRLQGVWLDLLLALAAWIGVAGIAIIERSSFGQRLVAIREDEVLAASIGIDVVRGKLLAFFCTSLYAALGGTLYATYVGFISPRGFDMLLSTNIWLAVAFGGRGTVMGPVIGAVILTPIPYVMIELADWKDVIYGALVIVVMIFMPGGIYREAARLLARARGGERTLGPARVRK